MSEPTKLLVIWSSADREVALHSVFMYAHNLCLHRSIRFQLDVWSELAGN